MTPEQISAIEDAVNERTAALGEGWWFSVRNKKLGEKELRILIAAIRERDEKIEDLLSGIETLNDNIKMLESEMLESEILNDDA